MTSGLSGLDSSTETIPSSDLLQVSGVVSRAVVMAGSLQLLRGLFSAIQPCENRGQMNE